MKQIVNDLQLVWSELAAVSVALIIVVVLSLLVSGCAINITCPQDGCVFGGVSATTNTSAPPPTQKAAP